MFIKISQLTLFLLFSFNPFLQIEHSKLTNSGFESEQLTPCMFVCSPNNCSQDFFKDEKQVLSKTCRISGMQCNFNHNNIFFHCQCDYWLHDSYAHHKLIAMVVPWHPCKMFQTIWQMPLSPSILCQTYYKRYLAMHKSQTTIPLSFSF